ncbi:MAG: lipoyl(octanoyl) transferase LipB [Deltaproteobacteria bacterium]|nr:lipoyl(octanoyl) transferase LipB [Deltaproteobacteria bacterium]
MTRSVLRWTFLGRVPYGRALALQTRLKDEVRCGSAADTLLLVEHPPVITLGRSAQSAHVLISEARRASVGVELFEVGRGGDVTYHGPGQLVGYPIRRIGRAIRPHVDGMMQSLVTWLRRYGIEAWFRDDAPGVWTAGGKIAAVGVDARGGVATHGFALNLAPELSHFQMIVPCGLTQPVTSVAALAGSAPELERAAREMAALLGEQYHSDLVELTPSALGDGS